MINSKKEKHLQKDISIKKGYTPTRQIFGIFQALWTLRNPNTYKFTNKDNGVAKRLWRECRKNCPQDPLKYFKEMIYVIMENTDIYSFEEIEQRWGMQV